MGYSWGKNKKWDNKKIKITWSLIRKDYLRIKLNNKRKFNKGVWSLKKRSRLLNIKYLRCRRLFKNSDVFLVRNQKYINYNWQKTRWN